MAGARIEFDNQDVIAAIGRVLDAVEHPAPLFQQISDHLKRSHDARFKAQVSPQGTPWRPLSPAYQRRKHKNADKVLTLRGHLRDTLRGNVSDTGLEFGTNQPYGAIHQFGGVIKKPASQRTLHFRQGRDGTVGNRFVKESRSNFAQDVTVREHGITMPARPWLGTTADDERRIIEMTQEYLQFALRR
jgi:phage virion morphogenesis protein